MICKDRSSCLLFFRAKLKLQQNADPPSTKLVTSQDEVNLEQKRAAIRQAVQKHRSNQSVQKKRRVREKRKDYYYKKKAEKEALEFERLKASILDEQKNLIAAFFHRLLILGRLEDSKKKLKLRGLLKLL